MMLVAMLAFSLAASANACAEETGNPLILPEPTEAKPLKFTSTAGSITLNFMSLGLVCLSGSSSGEFTSKRLGKITMSFSRCEAKNPPISCRSQGDERGVILFIEADLHLVAFKVGSELRVGVVIKLAKAIKIECTDGTFEWRGSVIAPLSGVSGKTKTATFSFSSIHECELDKEFCFEGSVHRKFKLEWASSSEFMSLSIERADSVTFETEVLFDF
ncbi:MAG TPA: hypothetical protein VK272_05900 [Solirubrobacteraceae bacterium]|nr:hypothetical protein [Solirubrobacteraceae bacterium]